MTISALSTCYHNFFSHLWICLRDVLEHGGDGDGLLRAEPRLLATKLHTPIPPVRYEALGGENLQRTNGIRGLVRLAKDSLSRFTNQHFMLDQLEFIQLI